MAIPSIPTIGTSTNSASSGASFKSSTAASISKQRQRTELQELQLLLAAQMQKDSSKSFVDSLKSAPRKIGTSVKDTVFGTLDILSRPGQFVVGTLEGGERSRRAGGGALAQLKAGFEQGVKGFRGEQVNLFGNYLEARGILVHHDTSRAVAGFVGDVLSDPLTYVAGVGVATKVGGVFGKAAVKLAGANEIRIAGKAGEIQLRESSFQSAKFLGEGTLSKTDLDKGLDKAMHRAFATADESQNIAGGFATHNNIALRLQANAIRSTKSKNIEDAKLVLAKSDDVTDQKFLSEIEAWTEAAFNGYQKNVQKLAQMTIAIPFAPKSLNFTNAVRDGRLILNPTHIGDFRVAPRVPSIDRAAAGQSLLASVPAVGKAEQLAAQAVGGLIPGFGRAADHALEMAAKHTRNLHHARIVERFTALIGDSARQLSKKERNDATDFYWGEGSVRASRETDNIVLNENKLRRAVADKTLTQTQADFIRGWHKSVEDLRKQDEVWGNKFDWDKSDANVRIKRDGTVTGGRGYVPHVYTPSGRQLSTIQDRFKSGDAWWTKAKTLKLTPTEIRELQSRNKLGKLSLFNIETDSLKLLAIRGRASANKRIDKVLEQSIAEHMGIPLKLPDVEKVQGLIREAADLTGRQERIIAQLSPENQTTIRNNLLDGKRSKLDDAMKDEVANTTRRLKDNDRLHGRKPNAAASQSQIRKGHRRRMDVLRERRRAIIDGDLTSPDLKAAIRQIAAQQKKQQRAFDKMERRLKVLKDKDLPKAQNALPNKHVRDDYVKVAGIRNAAGTEVAIPKELAAMWQRIQTVVAPASENVANLGKWYNQLMSKWKLLVTSVNPGYRIRNTMTDIWNAFIAGMPVPQMAVHGTGAMKDMNQAWMHLQVELGQTNSKRYKLLQKAGLKPNAESRAIMDEAMRLGVLSGLFQGDIADVARTFELASTARHKINPKIGKGRERFRPLSAYSDMMLTFNRSAENWGRLMHYRWRRQTLKQSPSEAARIVRIAHFDYEDLTEIERTVGKKLFPFYTWTRKNIPYQIRQIFQHPGRVAAFPKAAREFQAAAEGNDTDDFSGTALAPDWVNQRFGFRVPGGGENVARFVAPQLGIQDIEKLDDPLGAFKELLAPIPKAVIELGLNKSLLTGAPIEGTHPRNPVNLKLFGLDTAPVFKPVAGAVGKLVPGLPDPDFGQTSRLVGDEQVSGPGINPYWSWLFGQVPATNFMFNQKAEIKEKQRRMDKSSELSYLGGLRFVDVEQQQEILIRRIKFQEEAARHIRGLRDEDLLAEPDTSTTSQFTKDLEAIIRGGG